MKLRPYQPEDAATIIAWIRNEEEFRRWSVDRYDRYPIVPADINHKYIDCHGDCPGPEWFFPVMAEDGDKIFGHLILRYPDAVKRTVRLGFVIVDSGCRGEGYGKALLRLALEFAFRELKAEKVTLGVLEDNHDAIHCYEAVGFRDVTPEEPEYYFLMGKRVGCQEMELDKAEWE